MHERLAGLLVHGLGLALLFNCAADVAEAQAKTVTFTKDVAPILYRHCVSCHREGEIAPMSLVSYKETRPWARAILQAVLTRKMPPWKADPHYGDFQNANRLSEADMDVIRQWVGQGSVEGNPRDLPKVPAFSEGWRIGKPDVVFYIPKEYKVAPGTSDDYVYFTVPTNFTEDKWVTAVELRPGNRRVVHHAHVSAEVPDERRTSPASVNVPPEVANPWEYYFYRTASVRHLRKEVRVLDDGCSEPSGGYFPGVEPPKRSGYLGSFLPGREPETWPAGFARRIPAGSTLRFQIHYSSTTEKIELDRTHVGLIYADKPPEAQRVVRIAIASNYFFRIPPGTPNHLVTACYSFDEQVDLLSYTAHMHYRGKDARFEALYPDGRTETLLFVPNYSFDWQGVYRLKEPLRIPKGTRIRILAHFDNSANNPSNPDPTATVRWGEPSAEEMMDGWLEYVVTNSGKGARGR